MRQMFSNAEIGIDLGTANLLVYSRNKGIVFNEPSVAAINKDTGEVLAIGAEAKRMVGKTPENIQAIRPLKDGVISDYQVTTDMIGLVMKKLGKTLGGSIRKPNVVVCTPFGATSVEKRAIHDAVKQCGAKSVQLIEEPVAAAIGAEMPIDEPVASMIVDIGGGTTEAAIISFGGVVSCESIRVGGDQFDQDIIHYIRKKYKLLIGERTAEQIKMEIGYALVDHEELEMEVYGRDLVTGMPKTIMLSSKETQAAMRESLEHMLNTIRAALEVCPPELSGDIVERGIILTGGGALLKGMQEWLSQSVIVPVHVAPDPLASVAIGTGKSLKMLSKLRKLK